MTSENNEAAMREQARNGICPLCGKGAFRSVAGHVSRKHGIDRFQFKDMIGVYYSEGFTDPELRAAQSERGKKQYAEGRHGIRPRRKGDTVKLSKAAAALQRDKVLSMPPEARARGAQMLSRRRLEETRERDDEIARLAGEGKMNMEIASRFDIHPATVQEVLRRRGIESDGRARYMATKRGIEPPALRSSREEYTERMNAEGQELVERFRAGESPQALALERGISIKAMKARLKRYGASLPDGRKDPNRKKPPPRPKAPPRYCSLPDCDNRHKCKGLCSKHYQRMAKRLRDEIG